MSGGLGHTSHFLFDIETPSHRPIDLNWMEEPLDMSAALAADRLEASQ
jgi:hypothetical protein